jgi:hypothetical protein
MGFSLHKNSKEKWDLYISVNVLTNSLLNFPKCKGGLANVFCKINGLLDSKGMP